MRDLIVQFVRGYEWYEVLFELAVIWACVYLVFRFLRGTRGAGAIKGFALLLAVLMGLGLMAGEALSRLNVIYERFIQLLAIVLIVVFQPELRQAMIRLGQARFFRGSVSRQGVVVDAVSQAVEFLSKNQFGALIAIERDVKLGGLVEGGETLDARVSARLLGSIFWPNSPLHDLGVVIRGDRIVAANVQFPLIEEGSMSEEYGSRHRAAAGLTVESDCLVVIVSEETGAISLAERGRIDRNIPRDQFRDVFAARLATVPQRAIAETPQSEAPAAGAAPTTTAAAEPPASAPAAGPDEGAPEEEPEPSLPRQHAREAEADRAVVA